MNGTKRIIAVLVLCVFSVICAVKLSPVASTPESHRETIQYLEERKTTVLELAGATTAASFAITAIPDDVGTPIAEKLADLSSTFLLILSVLILEKYLVTLTGFALFSVFIPVSCVLFCLFLFFQWPGILKAGASVLLLGVFLYALVPTSVWISKKIENTYQDLQSSFQSAMSEEASVENSMTEEVSSAASEPEPVTEDSSGSVSDASAVWWQVVLNRLSGQAESTVGAIHDKVEQIKEDVTALAHKVELAPEKLSQMLNHFIEAVAVLIVTSCLIPVIVMLVFLWAIRLVLGIDSVSAFSSFFSGKYGWMKKS